MPNWCYNTLSIEGPDTQRFWEASKGKRAVYKMSEAELRHSRPEDIEYHEKYHGFCFNALVPVPEEILSQGYSDAGYQWQIAHWGTKWDVYEDHDFDVFTEEEEYIGFNFETAWSPPREWLLAATIGFPAMSATLAYHEEGMSFAGKMVVQNGKLITDEHYASTEDMEAYAAFLYDEFGMSLESEEDEEE